MSSFQWKSLMTSKCQLDAGPSGALMDLSITMKITLHSGAMLQRQTNLTKMELTSSMLRLTRLASITQPNLPFHLSYLLQQSKNQKELILMRPFRSGTKQTKQRYRGLYLHQKRLSPCQHIFHRPVERE